MGVMNAALYAVEDHALHRIGQLMDVYGLK